VVPAHPPLLPWYAWLWLLLALAILVTLYALIFAYLGIGWLGTIFVFACGAAAFFVARWLATSARRRR